MGVELRLIGASGCYHINSDDGALDELQLSQLVILEDTVISNFKGFNNDSTPVEVDLLTKFNLTGKTIKAGCYISVPLEWYISEITIDSGSSMGYIKTKE